MRVATKSYAEFLISLFAKLLKNRRYFALYCFFIYLFCLFVRIKYSFKLLSY